MEKIIFMCREPERHKDTVALIESIFPECAVEIIAESNGREDDLVESFEKIGSSFQLVPFCGLY